MHKGTFAESFAVCTFWPAKRGWRISDATTTILTLWHFKTIVDLTDQCIHYNFVSLLCFFSITVIHSLWRMGDEKLEEQREWNMDFADFEMIREWMKREISNIYLHRYSKELNNSTWSNLQVRDNGNFIIFYLLSHRCSSPSPRSNLWRNWQSGSWKSKLDITFFYLTLKLSIQFSSSTWASPSLL